jgi:hypothetical protein
VNWEGLICKLLGHKRTVNTVDSEGPWYVYCRRCYVFIENVKETP